MREIVGTYQRSNGRNGYFTLELTARGRYQFEAMEPVFGGVSRSKGRFVFQDGVVHLQGEREIESATLPRPLRPIIWGKRMYLVPKDRGLVFCNTVNLGLLVPISTRLCPFFLRHRGAQSPVTGLPRVPKTWRPNLLESPVEGTVRRIVFSERRVLAIMDVGRIHGVKVGMLLLAVNGRGRPKAWLKVANSFRSLSIAQVISTFPRNLKLQPNTGWLVTSQMHLHWELTHQDTKLVAPRDTGPPGSQQ